MPSPSFCRSHGVGGSTLQISNGFRKAAKSQMEKGSTEQFFMFREMLRIRFPSHHYKVYRKRCATPISILAPP